MPSFPASAAHPRRVLIPVFTGSLLLDIAGPAQVLETASRVVEARGGSRPYAIVTASLGSGPITTDTGIALSTTSRDAVGCVDTLLVPGGATVFAHEADEHLIGWIGDVAGRARRTASVCLGAFLLAAAGLLRGRRAVTHWRYCAELADRYPDVRVESDPIFVRDGTVWTSAGVSAGIDLALALVEEDLGHGVALEVAQRLVVFLKRPGGQAQFSRTLQAQSADRAGHFEALHAWMAGNLAADLRVELLAERAGLSPRTFARLYAVRTGTTPARAVETLRIEAARTMLSDEPDLPIATVARRCGFGDDERMRRAFVRGIGVPPIDYRARFRSKVPAAPGRGGDPGR